MEYIYSILLIVAFYVNLIILLVMWNNEKLLSNYANANGLTIMGQLTFERITNNIGRDQFRLDLADYIEKNKCIYIKTNIIRRYETIFFRFEKRRCIEVF